MYTYLAIAMHVLWACTNYAGIILGIANWYMQNIEHYVDIIGKLQAQCGHNRQTFHSLCTRKLQNTFTVSGV